ncbi:hypothetical protein [Saccharibacillus sacchari]|uniref:Uncharacterized protein n=1 Tax=Saccharibacillus sacchari TaxID=456493 RepID=A0ACC6PCG4_9BACL
MITNKRFLRASTVALALAVGFGGIGFQPSALHAAEPGGSTQASIPLAYLNDPLRVALINLNSYKEDALDITQSYSYDPDSYRYHDLIALQNKAYVATLDPAASQAELSAIKQDYEKALSDYVDFYIDDGQIQKLFSTLAYVLYYHDSIGQDESKLTASQRAVLHAVWDAQKYAQELGWQNEGSYIKAFKDVYMPKSAQAGELLQYDPAPYLNLAAKYRADIQARLAALGSNASNHANSVNAFEQAASSLEQLASGKANSNQVKMGEGNLEVRYATLVDELKRNSPIENSEEYKELKSFIALVWKHMDAPKGIGPGQYPQSAFGDLRRALRQAERVLETATTLEQLKQANTELSQAQMKFLLRIKPTS